MTNPSPSIEVPEGLKDILLDFTVAVLKDKVETSDLTKYAKDYFAELHREVRVSADSERDLPLRQKTMSGKRPTTEINVMQAEEENATNAPAGEVKLQKSTVDLVPLPDGVAARTRDEEVEMSSTELNKMLVRNSGCLPAH